MVGKFKATISKFISREESDQGADAEREKYHQDDDVDDNETINIFSVIQGMRSAEGVREDEVEKGVA